MAKDLLIGSHVGMNGPDYYLGSVKEAISYGATTFMFYTGAPQNSFRKPLNELKIEEGRALLKEQGFDESKIVVHAPYIIHARADGDHWLNDFAVFQTLYHRAHYLACCRHPTAILDDAEAALLIVLDLQVIEEVVHHWEYACIVARCSHYNGRITESILDDLGHIVAA